MESNMQIHFIFSNDFFDVIVKSIDEAERLSLMKIPNMLIVKELFNSPCSTLREYFRQMEIDLDRAEEEMNNYLEAYVEEKSERKVKPKSTSISVNVTTDDELSKFFRLCDYKTLLSVRNSVLDDDDPIDESAFILGLLKNEDKDFLNLLKTLDKVHLKPWLLQMHFNGVLAQTIRVQTFQSHFYS